MLRYRLMTHLCLLVTSLVLSCGPISDFESNSDTHPTPPKRDQRPAPADSKASVKRVNGVDFTVWRDEASPLAKGDVLTISFSNAEATQVEVEGMEFNLLRHDSAMVALQVTEVTSPRITIKVHTLLSSRFATDEPRIVDIYWKGDLDQYARELFASKTW